MTPHNFISINTFNFYITINLKSINFVTNTKRVGLSRTGQLSKHIYQEFSPLKAQKIANAVLYIL